jgi:hypothetical protein
MALRFTYTCTTQPRSVQCNVLSVLYVPVQYNTTHLSVFIYLYRTKGK